MAGNESKWRRRWHQQMVTITSNTNGVKHSKTNLAKVDYIINPHVIGIAHPPERDLQNYETINFNDQKNNNNNNNI